MPTNKEITENLPYTRKGICAECGKSIPLDSEANSEYDFYQHRRYSTMNYKIDYHFCSRSCMQKKIGKQPLSNIQAKAEGYKQGQIDTAKQIFKELDEAVWEQIEPSRLEEFYEQFSNAKDLKASLNVATAFSIIGLDAEKYEALKKQYNLEA